MQLSNAQAAWFRLRRSGLVEPFESAEAVASALVGVQAQYLQAAGLSLWNRTPELSAEALDELLYDRRTLVKIWGVRNTLHLYPSIEWPLFTAALEGRAMSYEWWLVEKEGVARDTIHEVAARLEKRLRRGGTLSREDVRSAELELHEFSQRSWAGILGTLVRQGVACHAKPGERNEARFIHRESWLPDLEWYPPTAEEAQLELARRYLAAYGPATVQDLAFWHGAKVGVAREWVIALADEVLEVEVDGARSLALRVDADSLAAEPPAPARWPVRLLYRFDPLLLALKDKRWLVDEEHYRRVWRPAGHIEGTVLVRGRVAGTWRYDRRASGLRITIDPFGPLFKTVSRALEKQAVGIARFFGLELAAFTVGPH